MTDISQTIFCPSNKSLSYLRYLVSCMKTIFKTERNKDIVLFSLMG